MRHRDREKRRGEVLPLASTGLVTCADGLVVEVLPVEVEVGVKRACSRVGKVPRLIGSHSHKDLNQAEETREHALVRVFFDLSGCLAYGHATALELDMDDRHAVDEQAQVSATVVQDLALRRIDRLLSYLVAALAGCDLLTIIDLQAHLLAQVKRIVGVVARDGDGLSVDEPVERERGLERFDLFDDLCHLALGERAAVQAVYVGVVLKQNLRPVVDEVLLGGIAKHAPRIVPAMLLKNNDYGFFEGGLFVEKHVETYLRRREKVCIWECAAADADDSAATVSNSVFVIWRHVLLWQFVRCGPLRRVSWKEVIMPSFYQSADNP